MHVGEDWLLSCTDFTHCRSRGSSLTIMMLHCNDAVRKHHYWCLMIRRNAGGWWARFGSPTGRPRAFDRLLAPRIAMNDTLRW